jgi:Asp-tRNA(Asn)/Glu-tRNA(Gln) amidotransferase B subunit
MSIKENAKSQFKDKLSGELNSIEVPEWGETIYYKNAINGKKQGQIMSLYDKGKVVDSVCMSLIQRALDKDGNAIWRPAELQEMLREYDIQVISRIVEVIADNEATVEDAKKQ